MPAVSVKQRQAMAIAEHHPEELYARNSGLKKMSKSQLHDFASTKEANLPTRAQEYRMYKSRKSRRAKNG